MRAIALAAALAATALVGVSGAGAEERTSPYEKIKDAVIRKTHTVDHSHTFAINVGGGFGQEYTHDLQFGISYRYHPSNYVGVGFTFLGGLPFETGLVDEIRTARPAALNNVRPESMRAAGSVDL